MTAVKEQLLKKNLLGLAKRNEYTRRDDVILGHNTISKNKLTLHLADVWGFCYGVLYAIEAVGEVLEENPDKTVWVLGELIHNNHVNDQLREMGANFIKPDEVKDRAGPDDIVVVPAFGTKEKVFDYLDDQPFETVDTTCPEVKDVEEEVQRFDNQGYTTIIHGKHEHQESIATSSFADPYLIIRDEAEAELVCEYILNGGETDKFLDQFGHACSEGFNPNEDLDEIGLANQTTMLMNESMSIFEMIESAVEERDGSKDSVQTIDTICSATQDRQDAVNNITDQNKFDCFLVVGGYHSSNTKNLARTAESENNVPAFHVEDADCFDASRIEHLPYDATTPVTTENWLPEGNASIGLTAGASTPHSELETIVKKLLGFY
jgi:4-hydroxy-3-methylbut-2-enyl diphosphate reductase